MGVIIRSGNISPSSEIPEPSRDRLVTGCAGLFLGDKIIALDIPPQLYLSWQDPGPPCGPVWEAFYLSTLDYNLVLVSGVQHCDSVIHVFFFIIFSIMVYHRTLNMVLCAMQ